MMIIEYSEASDFIRYHYSGLMYELKSRGVNLCVTPNHNLYVAKGNSHGNYLHGTTQKYDFVLTTPDTFFRKSKRFLKSGTWIGKKLTKFIIHGYSYTNTTDLTGRRQYTMPNLIFDISPFLTFLGFYTAEGCSDERGNVSIACCNVNKKGITEREYVENFLTLNNFTIRKTLKNKPACIYKIYSTVLARWLIKEVGHLAQNKKVPDFIKELNPVLIREYLNALFKGDGHKSKTAEILCTTSKDLADDVQELIIKCGYSASISTITPNMYPRKKPSFIKSTRNTYYVNWLKKSNDFNIENKSINHGKKYSEEWVKYDDEVFCVSVPYNKLLVRREGKVVWCGNSLRYYVSGVPEEDLKSVRKLIRIAERRSGNICEVCGDPCTIKTYNYHIAARCKKHVPT